MVLKVKTPMSKKCNTQSIFLTQDVERADFGMVAGPAPRGPGPKSGGGGAGGGGGGGGGGGRMRGWGGNADEDEWQAPRSSARGGKSYYEDDHGDYYGYGSKGKGKSYSYGWEDAYSSGYASAKGGYKGGNGGRGGNYSYDDDRTSYRERTPRGERQWGHDLYQGGIGGGGRRSSQDDEFKNFGSSSGRMRSSWGDDDEYDRRPQGDRKGKGKGRGKGKRRSNDEEEPDAGKLDDALDRYFGNDPPAREKKETTNGKKKGDADSNKLDAELDKYFGADKKEAATTDEKAADADGKAEEKK